LLEENEKYFQTFSFSKKTFCRKNGVFVDLSQLHRLFLIVFVLLAFLTLERDNCDSQKSFLYLSIQTGLPDGLFSNQKYQLGNIFESLEMENIGTYILCPFGDLVEIWYIVPRFGILYTEKSGNPAFRVCVCRYS
jgi:hypothetical protein